MAQTGYTPIQIYSSSTASQAPSAGNLINSTLGSELAINITDGKLFYKDNGGSVQVIAWKVTPTTAGGTGLTSYVAGDTLYYASGTTLSKLAIGSTGYWMGSSGTAPQWNAPAALTKTDDTNVTLTLGGNASTALLNAASLTLGWTGQLAATRGGTGIGSYAVGDLLYADTTTTLSKLADVATGNALISGGVGVAPSWGKIGLTTHVSGTLPTANGGTNLTSFTANGVMYASSTSALATGSALTFDGTTLGVGVAGSAWSTLKAIDLGTGGAVYGTAAQGGITANAYYGASGFVYKATNTAGVYQIVGNSHRWSNAASGTAGTAITFREDLRLTSAGDLEVKTGNITQGTAAKGINFTANTPASGMTSQLLNWYEEGTWTPDLKFGGANTGITYTTRQATYTRIGRTVFVQVGMYLSNKGSATGDATIAGLPFTVSNAAFKNEAGIIAGSANLTLTGVPVAVANPNNTNIVLQQQNNGTSTNLSDTAFANNTYFGFALTYTV